MLSSPTPQPSRPRILKNRTNAPLTRKQTRLCFSDEKKGKRVASEVREGQNKRVKLDVDDEVSEESDSGYETGTDAEDEVPPRRPQMQGVRRHERLQMQPLGHLRLGEGLSPLLLIGCSGFD